MTTVSLSDAKAHLSDYVKAAEDTHDRTTITKNGKPAAVLISCDDLESILATAPSCSPTPTPTFGSGRRTTSEPPGRRRSPGSSCVSSSDVFRP